MRKCGKILAVMLLAVLAAGCSREFEQLEADVPETMPEVSVSRISVELSDALASAVESGFDVFEGCGVSNVERIYPEAGEWEPRHREAGLHRWYSMEISSADSTKAVDAVKAVDGVLYATVQPRVKYEGIPFNDKYAYLQWGLFNTGIVPDLNEALFAEGADINVVPVWEKYTAGSPDVIVAVLDGGIYYHPDLNGVIIPAGEDGSKNFVTKYRDNPYLIVPQHHATCVGSIIASINNNGDWFCGVAGGKDGKGGVRLLNCQIIAQDDDDPETTHSTNDIMAAMVWAADHGAVISNNSWGYDYDNESEIPKETPRDIADAIDYFTKYAGYDAEGNQTGPMAGGLVVMAAGNENWGSAQPAMYENLVAVGATGPSGERAAYSNYGDWVDICAPGGNRNGYSEALGRNARYAMVPSVGADKESTYAYEGTSMSCPFVSGVAALMVSYFGGPGFTVETLKEMLLRGANTKFKSVQDEPIGPMLDAYGAFNAACAAPAKPEDFSVGSRGNHLVLRWKVTGNSGLASYAYRAQVCKDKDFKYCKETLFVTSDRKIGEMVEFEIPDMNYDTRYYVRLFGEGADKSRTEPSEVVEIKTKEDMLPVIVKEIEGRIMDGEEVSVSLDLNEYFSDPDGEVLAFNVSPESSKPLSAVLYGSNLVLTTCGYGPVNLTVSAIDYAGNVISQTFSVLVRDSQKRLFDLFPVPVDDVLNIRPGTTGEISFRVKISSVGGAVIFDDETSGSAFKPAMVNMELCGPGVYNVDISSPLGDYAKSVVKR